MIAAVLELAGQKAEAVPFAADEPLDESWAEPAAFDGCSSRGQAAPEPAAAHPDRRAAQAHRLQGASA